MSVRHLRRTTRPRGTALAAAAVLAAALTACGGGESLEEQGGGPSGDGGKGSLVIGSANFTESEVLAQLYAQVLADAGYDTRVQQLANRELYEPALEAGDIDVVPEYAATLAEFLNARVNGAEAAAENPVASNDAQETVAELRELAEPRGLTVLPPGDAVNQNAFAVTADFARRHDLATLSDVGEAGLEIRLAAGDECPERPYCQPGLEDTYGIDVTALDPKGVGTVPAKQSVADGGNDMVLTTTTDATLERFGLVLLEDDKGLQNADNVLPVLNTEDAGDEAVTEALDRLTRELTTEDLTALNGQVDAERRKAADVARDYLEEHDLVG
ncbi:MULTISPECIES: ABC transporter substrate-binding protein [Streptomyces]|uniref:ABC transporter substrate-binding protein n=1 Tax=Streptomyces TaxID=1883 RepID=UPI0022493509|nr:ABC transporter substrate-binding protein [Streptomyces sp. JHD 1]MCX2970751.1 ABC transporter substrate-binding protein [Streptomyces sp. JHD 1]